MFCKKFKVTARGAEYTQKSFVQNDEGVQAPPYEVGQVVVAIEGGFVPFTLPLEVFEKHKPTDFDSAWEVAESLNLWPWALVVGKDLEEFSPETVETHE